MVDDEDLEEEEGEIDTFGDDSEAAQLLKHLAAKSARRKIF